MTDAHGLEHAPEAVIEVQAKDQHEGDVGDGDGRDAKTVHDVVEGVQLAEGKAEGSDVRWSTW